jgi:DNA-binding NarL/FixJ family response regulator
MSKIKIAMADDHNVVRTAVAAYLAKKQDLEIVGEVADPTLLSGIIDKTKPDVLVLDAHMPGHKIIKTAKQLHKQYPELRILILSAYDRHEYIVGLLKAGAAGYVLKSDSLEMLVKAIRVIANGQEWLSPRVVEILIESVRSNNHSQIHLTSREKEVLKLITMGCKNSEIADKLVITVQTVKNHVSNIFNKLGVESRVEAVLFAVNHDLVPADNEDEMQLTA